ncbi:unnamed protein product [Rangifer tarandus platyrhynchus]|uniref:Uncharacterized protein n=1 Tax=Rangifer tarandus platyrhynchus TaxID=3082113 RepID=A0ABN8YYT6_RANTA|nr:unnamed protein product [Rangifer tarandus platyrhynchus]
MAESGGHFVRLWEDKGGRRGGQGARGRRTSTQEAAQAEWAGPGRGTGSALSRTFLLPELLVTRLPEGLLPLQGCSGWPPEWMPHAVWVLIGLMSGQPLTKWPEGLSCLLGTPRHSHPTVIQAGTSCLPSAGRGGHRGGCQETPQGCLATARLTSCSTETRPEPGRAAHNSLWRLKTPILLPGSCPFWGVPSPLPLDKRHGPLTPSASAWLRTPAVRQRPATLLWEP